jgi:hypothetical protein
MLLLRTEHSHGPTHIFCLFVLLATLCCSAITRTNRGADGVLEPRFLANKSFAQIYTTTVLFEDSTWAQLQFVLTNLGITDHNATCKVIILHKSDAPLCWNKRYVRSQWSYALSPVQSLTIGTNRISIADNKTSVSLHSDSLNIDIAFNCVPDVVVPPNANVENHGRIFDSSILIRWSQVWATVQYSGHASKKLNGFGMMDFSRSNYLPSDLCRGWITFRGYNLNTNFLTNIRLPPGKKTPPSGWSWNSKDKNPNAVTELLLESAPRSSDNKSIGIGRIEATDKSFSITPETLLSRYSFVDSLGPFQGSIVKLVIGEPVTYFYAAKVKIPPDTSSIYGMLEYMRIE